MSARTCPHCGAANDLTRVFCAECGTRLPAHVPEEAPCEGQPAAAATAGTSAPPLPAPVRRRAPVKPIKQAQPSLVALLAKMVLSTAVLAAILAAVVQIVRAPDGIPPVAEPNVAATVETLSSLKRMGESELPISWTLNEKSVNEYLASTIRMAPEAIPSYGLGAEFQRAFVILVPGRVNLGIEQKFLTCSVYFLLEFEPQKSDAGLEAAVTGGALGRLSIPAALLPAFRRLFDPTLSALSPPLDAIRRADAVTIQSGDIKLQWAGTASSPR